MKIGILSVYSVDFGSFYQSYSLLKYLEQIGHDCELINVSGRFKYSPQLMLAVKGTKFLPTLITRALASKNVRYRVYLNLQNDINKLLISEEYKDISELSTKYDCIIIGSDELWSATNPNMQFIPEYFGIGIKCPVFSYATSGVTLKNPSAEMLEKMKSGLNTFSSISVRDSVTAQWVEELINRKPEIVLDPTLLNPCFEGENKYDNNFILVYGEHFSSEQIEIIRKFSQQNKMPVKSVVWKHDWCDNYLETKSASELQNYFKSSYYVMSSTFHGTIFAIVNKKNFTSFTTEMRGLKVKLVLEQLGLQQNLFENTNELCTTIDYQQVETVLNEQRKASEEYLLNALGKIEEGI